MPDQRLRPTYVNRRGPVEPTIRARDRSPRHGSEAVLQPGATSPSATLNPRMDLAPERGVGMNWLERSRAPEGTGMVWETPIVTEIAVGMEVTSYVSGEDEVLL